MSRLRVLGGAWRGRPLRAPEEARPTGARVREALFSIWGDRVEGARLLELFAGSGAVGLEALSRGAAEVRFVESDADALAVLEDNCRRLSARGWQIHRARLPAGLARLAPDLGGDFDLAFADPPYGFGAHAELLTAAAPLLAPSGSLVLEHSTRAESPERAGPLVRVDLRLYGDSRLAFFERRRQA